MQMSRSSPLILAFGDSLVAGYGLPVADGFAAQLERRLRSTFPEPRVINAGVSGNTTTDALKRLPRMLSALDHRPALAIVQIGPNDVLYQVPPSLTRSNLEALLVEFNRCGVPVLLTTVSVPPILAQRAAAYAGLHREVAMRRGVETWPFFPDGVFGCPDMVLADQVHPNAAAIEKVVDAMLPSVVRMVQRSPNADV